MQKKYWETLSIIIIPLIISWSTICVSEEKTEAVEPGVAMVNGEEITQGTYYREVTRLAQQVASTGVSLDDSQISLIEKNAMDNIIGSELLYQESLKKGIKIEEKVIEEKFNETKNSYSDETEWNSILEYMGLSESGVKTQIERGLAIQQYINQEFVQNLSVPDDEVRAFYDDNPDQFYRPAQVRASHILISLDADDDESKKDESWEEIQKIKNRIEDGEDFASLAKEFSQCPSSERGGDLGYFVKGQMVEPFEVAAFDMEIDEVSGIVKTDFGYHIIKLTDKISEGKYDFESVREDLKQLLVDNKTSENVLTHVTDLREKANVEILLEGTP